MTSEALIQSLSDLISVSLEKWIASHHLSLRSASLTSALRAPPSKGRRDRYTQNAPHSRPFLWKGLSSVARRGWLPRMLEMRFPISLSPPLSGIAFIKIDAKRRTSVCKEDFSTSLEMTIRQERLVFRRGVLATSKPISRLHTIPSHSVRRRQETDFPSPLPLPSPVRRGQACGPHRGSHS